MIRQCLYIDSCDWVVHVYYSVHSYYAEEITQLLKLLGCEGESLRKAYDLLKRGRVDTGLTYSNLLTRNSVMVIGHCSSASEFANSLRHESRHLETHIAQARGLDPYGESIAYVAGELFRDLYPKANTLLCDCCRRKLYAS